jgi:hypothetical protein
MDAGHGARTLPLRLIAAFTLAGALLGAGITALGERDYTARAYVIRIPPEYGTTRGLAFARRHVGRGDSVQLTGRDDFAIAVSAPSEAETRERAVADAKAIKRSMRLQPGLATIVRRPHGAGRDLGPGGWALFGAAGGLWLGLAAAIVRRGSGRAPRRALSPCPPGRPATRG